MPHSGGLRLKGMVEEGGNRVGTMWAQSYLQDGLGPRHEPVEVDLVRVSLAMMDMPPYSSYGDIFTWLTKSGLEFVDDLAPQLRLQYDDQPAGEALSIPSNVSIDWLTERRKTIMRVTHSSRLGRMLLYQGVYDETERDHRYVDDFVCVQSRVA